MTGTGIEGRVPCVLIGGPLDGAKYGDLPDVGTPYTGTRLTVPLSQPAEAAAQAVYTCREDAPVAGFWRFFYGHTAAPMKPDGLAVPGSLDSVE